MACHGVLRLGALAIVTEFPVASCAVLLQLRGVSVAAIGMGKIHAHEGEPLWTIFRCVRDFQQQAADF